MICKYKSPEFILGAGLYWYHQHCLYWYHQHYRRSPHRVRERTQLINAIMVSISCPNYTKAPNKALLMLTSITICFITLHLHLTAIFWNRFGVETCHSREKL